jgi:hypothetical protein
MIPRGEVGLIFANIGLTLVVGGQPVVSQSVFSAVVVMVIATTLVTPAMLSWSFARFVAADEGLAVPETGLAEATDASLAG